MKLSAGNNKIIANLRPVKYTLDAAVKKETVSPVSVKGDTIIFHASAVKVNKGESAIDVLEQMPGVEVSSSSVTVLGETVQNVYIDGALLFGNAPMKALNNLPAEEVVTIKSFQEYANKDPRHKISKNESKQRSLDISTKSKSKGVFLINAIAGAGYDTDTSFHKFRYTTGANFSRFSEKLQVFCNFNINNINDGSLRQRGNSFRQAAEGGAADLRDFSVSLGFNRNWMSPTTRNFKLGSTGLSYSYSDKYNVNESVTERIYFPTSDYSSRSSESSSYSSTTNKEHRFSVNGMKSLPDGSVSAGVSMSLGDNQSTSRSRMYNRQDNLSPQGTSSSTLTDGDSKSFGANLNISKGFFNKLRLGTAVSLSTGNSDAGTSKIDTTTSTVTNTILDIATDSDSRSFNISPSVRYELTDRSSLSLNYSYNNSYSQSERWAFDVTDPAMSVIDSVNTQIRTNDNNTHSTGLGFRTAFGQEDNIIFATGLDFVSTGLNRSDDFPEEEPVYSRRFNSLRPHMSFNTNSQINHWSASWSSSNSTPSIEQLRPRLNNTNLYSVSAGNPDLKQSTQHSFRVGYSTILGKSAKEAFSEVDDFGPMGGPGRERFVDSRFATFETNASFNVSSDVIVGKKTYFSQATMLLDYSYLMPAQSTFSTYENADAAYSASLSANVGVPLQKIKCTLTSKVSMNWDKSPSYINSVLTQTQNLRPTLGLGLRSNISRSIRFNIRGNASYVHSENDSNGKTDYFTEALRAGFELNNILKLMYVGGNYTKTFMQGISYTSIADNILDLNAGCRFGPRNNYDFAFKVHDLFNKTSGFSTSMTGDYVSNSWKHNFGRYVLFTFTYHFTSMKGGGGGMMRGGGPM
jgi:hypothetical protein